MPRAWRRSRLGLESLAAKVQALGIRCAATRVSSLYLAGPLLDAAGLAQECQARNAIGLPTAYLTRQALQARYGIRRGAALLSFDTLSADPLKLAAGFYDAPSPTARSCWPRSRWTRWSSVPRKSMCAPAPAPS